MMDQEENNQSDYPLKTPSERLRRILTSTKNLQKKADHDNHFSSLTDDEDLQEENKMTNNAPSNELNDHQSKNRVYEKTLDDTQKLIEDSDNKSDKLFSEFLIGLKTFFKELGNQTHSFFQVLFRKKRPGKEEESQRRQRNLKGCIIYSLLGFSFSVFPLGILGLSFLIIQYFTIAAGLPSIDDLRLYASQFETTRIYDRNSNLIYEILDPNAGRRTTTTLDEISPEVIAATIATEDKDFYTNPGFDPWGILRALWQNYTSGEVVSGASTITQQLARTLLLSPEERAEISTRRKTREIVLAAEITRKYSKDEILELYLNEIYYGNMAYGIEAAAETYFNTTADQLNLEQASFLAGLPQAPAVYDIFTNRDASLLRHLDVLNLMYQLSKERGCIEVSHYNIPVCVTLEEAVAAAQEIENYPFEQRFVNMPFPHWVNYIRSQLEKQYDPQTIYRSGFKVYTTLDPDFQLYAENALKDQVAALAENNANDGALVTIQPRTGEILAMVGSADFFNEEISGQVNMAVAPRQPGSSIKPLTYTAAFEKGWTPATLIWDVPSEFPPSGDPNDPREPYKPVNYDRKFHGPVLARTALGSSYNVPAVKTLDFIGIYDKPETSEKEGFIAFAERVGITTLTRDDYGLSLTLGGGDVSLMELTGVYALFANNGVKVPPYAIERIEDHYGRVVFSRGEIKGEQVIRAEHAYMITDILSDNSARTPAFGPNSILNLPFRVAVKTGTTDDFRDNWTLGYTPDLTIGVWIGNADYTPMENISGVTGAAPLWADVMQWAAGHYSGGTLSNFSRPVGIEDHVICSVSGTKPSEQCPDQKSEIFAQGQPPLHKEEDLWKETAIDTWTNLKAGSTCSEFTEEKLTLNVTDKWAKKWLTEKEEGKAWLEKMEFLSPVIFTPERECKGEDPRPTIVFVGMNDDMNVAVSPLDIYAVVSATDHFERFKLQYGIGNNPVKWQTIMTSDKQAKQTTKLASWDVYEVNATRITLRIYMYSDHETFAEKRIHLNLLVPTPIAVPTITPTPILIPTETEAATITPQPTIPLNITETTTPSDISLTTETPFL